MNVKPVIKITILFLLIISLAIQCYMCVLHFKSYPIIPNKYGTYINYEKQKVSASKDICEVKSIAINALTTNEESFLEKLKDSDQIIRLLNAQIIIIVVMLVLLLVIFHHTSFKDRKD